MKAQWKDTHISTPYLVLLAEILRLSPTVFAQGMLVRETTRHNEDLLNKWLFT